MDTIMSKKRTSASKDKKKKTEGSEVSVEVDKVSEVSTPTPKKDPEPVKVTPKKEPKPVDAPIYKADPVSETPITKIGLKEACRRFLPKFRDYQWPSIENYAKTMSFSEPATPEKCKELLRGWGAKKLIN